MTSEPSEDRPKPGVSWSERSRGHQLLAVTDIVLILVWAAALVIGWPQPVIWSLSGLVMAVVLVDLWLTWRLQGRLGRR